MRIPKKISPKIIAFLSLALLLFWFSSKFTQHSFNNEGVTVGRAAGSIYPEQKAIDMNLLVKTISSMLENPPRPLPEEKDIFKLDPHLFYLLFQHVLPNVKSPCWYEEFSSKLSTHLYTSNKYTAVFPANHKIFEEMTSDFQKYLHIMHGKQYRLRCLPYFYIIGQQKCGTTDLYNRLLLHPHVHFSLVKEPNWWTRAGFNYKGFDYASVHFDFKVPLKDYLDLFDSASRLIQGGLNDSAAKITTGDASTTLFNENSVWYYYTNTTNLNDLDPTFITADFIHAVQPDAKIIVLLRDPVERLFSDYLYFGQSNKSLEDFHMKVVQSVQIYQSCLAKKSLRSCTYNHRVTYTMKVKLNFGLYFVFLRDWLSVFPREQVLVLRLEDYTVDIRTNIQRVLDFLGVDPFSQQQEEDMLNLPILNKRHEEDLTVGPMLPATRDLLRQFYQPFNLKLAALLHNDGFLWSDQSKMDV